MEHLIKQEQRIDQHIEQGQKELAVELLYDLIITYAKAKDFSKAESLRERLIQVDSMALSEIVNSAEIIEEEKFETIDAQQRGLWKQLYDALTPEEGNAFYFAAKQLTLKPDQTIIKQGLLNDKLFFINKGSLRRIYRQGDEEYYVCQINMGETVGHDTYFSITLCTTSVITINGVQLSYLDRPAIQKVGKQFPGFENKLREFCFRSGEKIADILRKKEIERRRFERFKASGKIITQLVDKNGEPVGEPFQGHLEDICQGGVSYLIKCSQDSSARLLLGRPALVKMTFPQESDQPVVKSKGLIVAVKFQLFNDYKVHLRFPKLFTEDQISQWSL